MQFHQTVQQWQKWQTVCDRPGGMEVDAVATKPIQPRVISWAAARLRIPKILSNILRRFHDGLKQLYNLADNTLCYNRIGLVLHVHMSQAKQS